GQVITVAVLGSGFLTQYGSSADYFLASPPTPLAGQQMLSWNGVATAGPPPTPPVFTAADDAATLANAGETVVLFFWDQQSDLIQDVDQVNYAQNPGPTNQPLDKSGVSVDGPDANTTST